MGFPRLHHPPLQYFLPPPLHHRPRQCRIIWELVELVDV